MNDFTKEELVLMQLAINGYQSYDNHYPEALEPLFHKIQSIIDNYCEHEYRHSNEAHFKCINCGGREK